MDMIGARATYSAVLTMMILAGCGRSSNSPSAAAPIAAKPDVVVTMDGKRHLCIVALSTEALGSAISCNDIAPFVKDELRLPGGAVYAIRIIPDVSEAEVAKVGSSLQGAGYRFIGGTNAVSTQ